MRIEDWTERVVCEPWKVFLECPLLEVRKECLKQMNWLEERVLAYTVPEEVERVIRELAALGANPDTNGYDEVLAEELLECYLYSEFQWRWNILPNSLGFAISLVREETAWMGFASIRLPRFSKIVLNRALKLSLEEYPKVELLPAFMAAVLEKALGFPWFCPPSPCSYDKNDWGVAMRVLKVIHHFADYHFLPGVDLLIEKIRSEELGPDGEFERLELFPKDQHLVVLRGLKRRLERAKKVQQSQISLAS